MKKSTIVVVTLCLLIITAAVALRNTDLHLSTPLTANVGDVIPLSAQLTDDSIPLSGQLVDFTFDGNQYTVSTDAEGTAKLVWQPTKEGRVEINAAYPGNEQYASSFDIGAIDIVAAESVPLLVATTAPAPAATPEAASIPSVQEHKSCKTIQWQEEKAILGVCSYDKKERVCADEPVNSSCVEQITQSAYSCKTGSEMVTQSRQDCQTTGYTIANKLQIASTDYACSASQEGSDVILICDSKFDGNFDSRCNSGESCLKYIVHSDGSYEQLERNSDDNFVPIGDRFFLQKPVVEVLP